MEGYCGQLRYLNHESSPPVELALVQLEQLDRDREPQAAIRRRFHPAPPSCPAYWCVTDDKMVDDKWLIVTCSGGVCTKIVLKRPKTKRNIKIHTPVCISRHFLHDNPQNPQILHDDDMIAVWSCNMAAWWQHDRRRYLTVSTESNMQLIAWRGHQLKQVFFRDVWFARIRRIEQDNDAILLVCRDEVQPPCFTRWRSENQAICRLVSSSPIGCQPFLSLVSNVARQFLRQGHFLPWLCAMTRFSKAGFQFP